jgi:hypothetical protein
MDQLSMYFDTNFVSDIFVILIIVFMTALELIIAAENMNLY